MNLFKLSWKYLTFRPLSTGLNVFLLALGLAIITVLLLMQDQFEKKMNQDAAGIDLVVGAKGSPLQLILAGVYHIDFPTGNIPMDEAQKLSRNRLVKNIIPMALGDNYQGFRIVGTNHDYPGLYEAEMQSGELWAKPFEVVLGAEVAGKSGYVVGDEFLGSHGISVGSHEHDANNFRVVGILERKGNVLDRLILTSVESIWFTHDVEGVAETNDSTGNEEIHPVLNLQDSVATRGFPKTTESRELTTLLIQYRNPMAAIQLPRLINSGTSMQAASPSFEMSRLFELLGVGITLLQGLAIVIIGVSGLGIFIALYNSLKERKYDLAILRAIGASRGQLLLLIFLEGIMLTFMGAILGILLGHTFLSVIISQNEQGVIGTLEPWVFLKKELWIVIYALVVGVLSSIIPAVAAYQTSIAKQLTKA
ncbi:putative ABC transport system permease protein [Algoriphagus ratkowskyi]|uniref:FtsX-like permease family protein n=1 Tax=Algoriphagus ratkowskyi TaxID=57028 RepID=A0A2W7QPI4_9BACT|nr:FtsX-like permease family protein [Algoriphagus ratkowskyi]PZX50468.1 putative ABC transport system permease protein [Algoriphagus ratkowskyi]TXD75722.1 FtsX-like permease family protein [Algoriphagus ratkowskyi]